MFKSSLEFKFLSNPGRSENPGGANNGGGNLHEQSTLNMSVQKEENLAWFYLAQFVKRHKNMGEKKITV